MFSSVKQEAAHLNPGHSTWLLLDKWRVYNSHYHHPTPVDVGSSASSSSPEMHLLTLPSPPSLSSPTIVMALTTFHSYLQGRCPGHYAGRSSCPVCTSTWMTRGLAPASPASPHSPLCPASADCVRGLQSRFNPTLVPNSIELKNALAANKRRPSDLSKKGVSWA